MFLLGGTLHIRCLIQHKCEVNGEIFETFYVLTLKVYSSNYVTSNTHFVEIAELNLILKEMMTNEDRNLKEMAESMNEKFKKYWGYKK